MLERVAGAPISWGVCEVPGWGVQLPPERVLAEMRELGLAATELGPEGYLSAAPAAIPALLGRYGLRAVGGFVPVVLHRELDEAAVERSAAALAAAGAGTFVLAADTGTAGYDQPGELDDRQWAALLANLDRVAERCLDHGLELVVHPHVGTVIERRAEVERLLADSEVALCLDTGHLLLGGTDPVELARGAPERVRHVHLKDVDGAVAKQAAAGGVGYAEAVRAGLYRPLGHGDLEVAAVVDALESAGYHGWYVLEQDVTLDREPTPGAGPVEDVRASLDTLRSLAGRVG
jgi:inosose dehydratase